MADNLAFEKDDELKENVEQDVEKNDGYESVKGGTKIDDLEFGQMSPEQNGKPLEVKEEHDGPYAGMRKEDVLKYSNTPFWRGLRWTLLILLIAGWLALLGASIGLIVASPRCLPWWQTAVIYQIYPRSFLDANGTSDGIGDFAGITEKMDYIKDLGVGAILLNSIYKSPDLDFGYDVSDFMDVNENFGSMSDFEALLEAAHDRDLKVILDFVPNQASIESELFMRSALGGEDDPEEYLNGFTWSDTLPNNWVNNYGGPAWTYDDTRGQYYLHQYSRYQPDLNLDDANVRQYLEDAMDHWFSKGVDGLNIQGTQFLFEDSELRNEPINEDYTGTPQGYDSLLHYYTADYTGVHDLLNEWRDGIFFRYSTAGTYRLMITDANTNTTYMGSYYGEGDNPEADLVQNYNLLHIGDSNGDGGTTSGDEIDGLLQDWLNKIPSGEWPSFQLGNHHVRRIASRLSPSFVKAANMLLLTLPGTPICYYGDEIGMRDTQIETFDDVQDIKGKMNMPNWQTMTRDPERGPMQWNDSINAGFSKSDSWLPVADNYRTVNVERQLDLNFSPLDSFRRTVAFRSDNRAFLSTDIRILEHENDITAYIRSSDEQTSKFLVAISFSADHMYSDLYNKNEDLPLQGTVRVATADGREGNRVELNKLELFGGEGLIIELD